MSRLEPHQQRVIDEKTELDKKIHLLDKFMQSAEYRNVDVLEKHRLQSQIGLMRNYSYVLDARIDAFNRPGAVNELVTTAKFWELMCGPEFVRIGRHRGKIGEHHYCVHEAPEDVPGFIENRIDDTLEMIKPRTYWKRFIDYAGW